MEKFFAIRHPAPVLLFLWRGRIAWSSALAWKAGRLKGLASSNLALSVLPVQNDVAGEAQERPRAADAALIFVVFVCGLKTVGCRLFRGGVA